MAKSEIPGLLIKCSSGYCGRCEQCRPDLVRQHQKRLTVRDLTNMTLVRLLVGLKNHR
jgi:hypothetical protein